jgi:hypothetical protein
MLAGEEYGMAPYSGGCLKVMTRVKSAGGDLVIDIAVRAIL